MSKIEELTWSQRLILIGHTLEALSGMLIMVGTLIKRADELPEVSIQTNRLKEVNLSKFSNQNYWDS